jgi:alpha-tubulin suppressor-like RCC1 family protein
VLRLVAQSITNQIPEVALTSPVDHAILTAPATVTLTAAASDSDGFIAKVEFFQGATKLGEATSSPYQFLWSGIAAGTYALTAKAIDNAGGSATSSVVTVTVEAPVPQAPVVALTSPDDGSSFYAPASVVLSATASAFVGSIAKVEFYREGLVPVKIGESVDAPFGFTWSAVPPGTYTFTAKAYDTNGLTATSAARTVTVQMTVPYFTGFDTEEGYAVGPLGGQAAWTASSVDATITDTAGHQGGQAIQVTAAEAAVQAAHDVGAYSGHTVVFVDFFAKPVAGTVAEAAVFVQADVAHVALVGSGAQGELYVLNGNGAGAGAWEPTGFKVPLSVGGQPVDWLRVTLREDFSAKKWDLYAGGKLIAYDLGFTDGTKTLFSRIAFVGQPAGASVFDDLYVGFEHPLFANQSNDGIDDAWKAGYGLDTTANIRYENPDHDAWANIREYLLGTSPLSADTDGDLIPDDWEFAHGLNPLSSADAAISKSGDGWSVLMKYLRGCDPDEDERGANARLIAGGDQGLWLNAAGLAHVWGRNSSGQLGRGDTVDRVRMEALASLSLPVVAAAWGDSHGLAITQDCLVHAWGGNYFGQLGDGTLVSRRSPVVLGGLGSIVRVAAGDYHSLALRGDGTVWTWGGNQRGQLGNGSTASSRVPVPVFGLSRIVEIAAGASHSVALDTDGRVWVWGSNDFGQLGDATVSEWLTPHVLTGMAPFKKIASGRNHVLALERTGGVRAWGANQAGQLGIGSYLGQAIPGAVSLPGNISGIAAGDGFSLALEEGGFVWSWGANNLGQLGDDSASFNDPLPAVLGLELISEIAAGKDHALVLRDDGTPMSWGFNQHGQLGAPSVDIFVRAPQPVTPPAN